MATLVGVIWSHPFVTRDQSEVIARRVSVLPRPLSINIPSLAGDGILELEWMCAREGFYLYEWSAAAEGPERRIINTCEEVFFLPHFVTVRRGRKSSAAKVFSFWDWYREAERSSGAHHVHIVYPRREVRCACG